MHRDNSLLAKLSLYLRKISQSRHSCVPLPADEPFVEQLSHSIYIYMTRPVAAPKDIRPVCCLSFSAISPLMRFCQRAESLPR